MAAHGYAVEGRPAGLGRWPLLAAVRSARPDLIHLQWLDPVLVHSRPWKLCIKFIRTWLELALLRLASVPLVWTVHNRVSHESSHPRL